MSIYVYAIARKNAERCPVCRAYSVVPMCAQYVGRIRFCRSFLTNQGKIPEYIPGISGMSGNTEVCPVCRAYSAVPMCAQYVGRVRFVDLSWRIKEGTGIYPVYRVYPVIPKYAPCVGHTRFLYMIFLDGSRKDTITFPVYRAYSVIQNHAQNHVGMVIDESALSERIRTELLFLGVL